MKGSFLFCLCVDQLRSANILAFVVSVLLGVEGFLSAIQEQAKKDKK